MLEGLRREDCCTGMQAHCYEWPIAPADQSSSKAVHCHAMHVVRSVQCTAVQCRVHRRALGRRGITICAARPALWAPLRGQMLSS